MASPNATAEQKKQALYEFTKDKNLYEYGKDIIYNTEKMSLNRNILNKKYYIVIPYYSEELGQNDFDKDEVREMAFSELCTGYNKNFVSIRCYGKSTFINRTCRFTIFCI